MKSNRTYMAIVAIMACTLAACTDVMDDLAGGSPAGDDSDLICFSVSTHEMNDLPAATQSTTRSQADSTEQARLRAANHYLAHELEGDNPWGLKAWRMPLPIMGIHPGTVRAGKDNGDEPTRAPESEIASTNSFHDSLTIWGYTDRRDLCKQMLLKRVRNWRSSVHWPYDSEKDPPSTQMRFYAVAPSMEGLNLSVTSTPSFSSAPQFTYTLPETAAEMRDLLYGESAIVDVQAGPTGTGTNPKAENLGKDNKQVELSFNHILTAMRFAGSVPPGVTLKQIIVRGVYTKATFDPTAVDAATGTTGAWSDLQSTGSYTIWPNVSGPVSSYLCDSVLFMIPHTLTEGTTLEAARVPTSTHLLTEPGAAMPATAMMTRPSTCLPQDSIRSAFMATTHL